MSVRRIYFDLDGTLVDPATGITRCIRYALDRLGHACPSDGELHAWIGPPLHDSFASLVGDEQAHRAVALYRERYRDEGIREFTVYPQIPDTLSALRSMDYALAVATSKPGVFAEDVLRLAGLDDYFGEVHGAGLDGTHSNKTDLLRHAEASGGRPAAAMIGDRHFDIDAARNNGLAAIGVLWGYGSADELAGADELVDAPADLPALFDRPGS